MENNEFKKVRIKNRTCFISMTIKDFDLDNILIEEKLQEKILINEI